MRSRRRELVRRRPARRDPRPVRRGDEVRNPAGALEHPRVGHEPACARDGAVGTEERGGVASWVVVRIQDAAEAEDDRVEQDVTARQARGRCFALLGGRRPRASRSRRPAGFPKNASSRTPLTVECPPELPACVGVDDTHAPVCVGIGEHVGIRLPGRGDRGDARRRRPHPASRRPRRCAACRPPGRRSGVESAARPARVTDRLRPARATSAALRSRSRARRAGVLAWR